jgi:hypothetical protein
MLEVSGIDAVFDQLVEAATLPVYKRGHHD